MKHRKLVRIDRVTAAVSAASPTLNRKRTIMQRNHWYVSAVVAMALVALGPTGCGDSQPDATELETESSALTRACSYPTYGGQLPVGAGYCTYHTNMPVPSYGGGSGTYSDWVCGCKPSNCGPTSSVANPTECQAKCGGNSFWYDEPSPAYGGKSVTPVCCCAPL